MKAVTLKGPEETEFVSLGHLKKREQMKQSQFNDLTQQMEVSDIRQLS